MDIADPNFDPEKLFDDFCRRGGLRKIHNKDMVTKFFSVSDLREFFEDTEFFEGKFDCHILIKLWYEFGWIEPLDEAKYGKAGFISLGVQNCLRVIKC